jgi:hypothetical protein
MLLDIDKAILGRTVHAPIYVPATGPRYAHVLVMVARRTLGYGNNMYGWVAHELPKKCNRRNHDHRHRLLNLY